MRRSNLEDILPLSPLQDGLLFHALLATGTSDVYTVQMTVDLDGVLEPSRLEEACATLLRRHPNLRAGFRTRGQGRAMQFVVREVGTPWQYHDLSPMPAGERDAAHDDLIMKERSAPFVMARPPLLRFLLVRLQPARWQFVMTFHHILLDGWSMPLLVRELFGLYASNGAETGLSETVPYRDYLHWIARQDKPAATQAWLSALERLEGPTLIAPHAASRVPVVPSSVRGEIAMSETAALTAGARAAGLTLNTAVQGAWALTLHQLTGAEDVVFGATVNGRSPDVRGIETVIGLLINTLPVRVRLAPDQPIGAVLAETQSEQADLAPHQHLSLTDIQRSTGKRVLFDTAVVFENYPLGSTVGLTLADGVGLVAADIADAMHYPASLVALPGDALRFRLDYQPDLVSREHANRILGTFLRVLGVLADGFALTTREIARLAAGSAPVVQHGSTARDIPPGTAVDLFEHQVAATPHGVAVSDGISSVSYAELNARVNRLARHLVERGAGPGKRVALVLPRSIELVVALLATLRTGAAYVPVDPNYPADRVRFMLADSASVFVLTTPKYHDVVGTGYACVDVDGGRFDEYPDHDLTDADRLGALVPEHPAYLVYTSGSTGVPKGVVGLHAGLTNRLAWASETFPFAPGESVIGKTSISFLDGLTEVLSPLVNGARLVMVDDDVARSPAALAGVVGESGPCRITVVPSLLGALLSTGMDDALRSCGLWITSGESLPGALADTFRSRIPEARLVNFYGSSEVSADSLFSYCHGRDVAIGRPLWNTSAYVLDETLKPVPHGRPGELYLSGRGLARGYHGRPALTAERFLPCPFTGPGSRMYRTGDLVRWRDDGQLEYLGRIDSQVKIRGFRVELAEVEAAIADQAGVQNVIVVLREERSDRRLVAYLVSAGPDLDVREVRRSLRRRLPEHMVPSAFVVLDALPLNVNGKLDRAALPAPSYASGSGEQSPRDEIHEIIAAQIADVLGIDAVGTDDSFFDAGGHSLSAASLAVRLNTLFGTDISVRAVFEAPTATELAAVISEARGHRKPPLVRMARPERVPLSLSQRRLWFLNRMHGPNATYNESVAMRLRGTLDRDALQAALGDVVARHETLRTIYPAVRGVPEQRVLPTDGAIPRLSPQAAGEDELGSILSANARYAFDLSADTPVQAYLVVLGPESHVFQLVAHHIAVDGWSTATLARDLAAAYAARSQDAAPAWSELPVQYTDYALWQQEVLGDPADPDSIAGREAEFWKETLHELPDELELGADFDRPAVASGKGACVPFRVDAATHRRLVDIGRATNTTTAMVLNAALAAVLSARGAGVDIPIGFPVANRDDEALEGLVGFFVNTVMLRVDVSGDPTFRDLLGRVRGTSLSAYSHQSLPFDQVVQAVNPRRSAASAPLLQVMMAFRSGANLEFDLPGLSARIEPVDTGIARFDLRFEVRDHRMSDGAPAGLTGSVQYALDLFEAATAAEIGRDLSDGLGSLAADPDRPVSGLRQDPRADER